MKVTVHRDSLMDALTKVQSVVSTKSTIPVLANVLLEAAGDELKLGTTDLEVSVRTKTVATVAKEGATTLPAKRLFSVVRELPSFDIVLDVDDKNVATISCGTAMFKIVGLSASDFPSIPVPEGDAVSYQIEQGALRSMLKSISYAASMDETRMVLNGALFSFADQKLTVVATDGRRLALSEQELEYPEGSDAELVIPTKTLNELMKGLSGDNPVSLTAAGTQAFFDLGELQLSSKLIEGTFPNYRQVIPAACEERLAVERETLLAAVRRVSLVTNEQSNSIKLTFGENQLELVTVTPDVGEARETVPVKYTGREMTIAFNPEFLMAPLKVLDSDEVYFELIDELSPGVMKADVSFLYVIMPMRLQ